MPAHPAVCILQHPSPSLHNALFQSFHSQSSFSLLIFLQSFSIKTFANFFLLIDVWEILFWRSDVVGVLTFQCCGGFDVPMLRGFWRSNVVGVLTFQCCGGFDVPMLRGFWRSNVAGVFTFQCCLNFAMLCFLV